MPCPLYRSLQPGEPAPPGAVKALVTVEQPRHRLRPKVVYRCQSGGCPVQELVVRFDFDLRPDRAGRLGELRCPGCGGTAVLRRLVEVEVLVPAEGG